MDYDHECRECGLVWVENYRIEDPPPDACPDCASHDVFRQVGSSGFILKGAGWERDGYSKFKAQEKLAKKGRYTEFETKEDLARVMRGEAEETKRKELKALNDVSKRTLGYENRVTEKEANEKIKKAGDDAVKDIA